MRDRIHSSSLTLLQWLSLSYFEQSAKHHEETSSNLWAVGVWEIILSSFIFPSKPTDPRRNKLDIFNSCFNLSILIPVLTTTFQFLFGLQHFNSYPDDSDLIPFYNRFLSSCDLQHKGSFCLKLLIKLPSWKLSIFSSTHLFFLLIYQEAAELYHLNNHFCINGKYCLPSCYTSIVIYWLRAVQRFSQVQTKICSAMVSRLTYFGGSSRYYHSRSE